MVVAHKDKCLLLLQVAAAAAVPAFVAVAAIVSAGSGRHHGDVAEISFWCWCCCGAMVCLGH